MTIYEWLAGSMVKLRDAGVDSPRRDCLVFLEDLLEKDRAWVLTHHDFELSKNQLKDIASKLARRINREPLAYIRGKAWFYARFFEVSPDVLVPRPETETMIDLLIELSRQQDFATMNVLDIGTGSGCLAITAKLEFPNTAVIATDNDKKALTVAKANAKKYKAQIDFLQADLLGCHFMNDRQKSDSVILVNLPYVPDGVITSLEIAYEPKQALFSGADGMDHYRRLWEQIGRSDVKPKYIITESLKNQHKTMASMAEKTGYKLQKTEILTQLFTL